MSDRDMKTGRREFLRMGIAGLAGAALAPSILSAQEKAAAADSAGAAKAPERKFIHRTLGRTGLRMPIVSIGAQAQDPVIFKAALDAGLTHFDTAESYGRGQHETMIGEVVKGKPRDSFVITTKVYQPMDQKTGLFRSNVTADGFISVFEGSLKRLGLDYVDILEMHAVSKREAVLFEPVLTALDRLKKEGKARFIGASVHTNEPEVIDAVVESKILDVVLTSYNFRQPHLAEVRAAIERAAKAGIGIVAMKTQAGVYWDKERKNQINMKAALKWALSNENIHTAIPGFTTLEQMNDDISVMEDLALTAEEMKDLQLGMLRGFEGLYCSQCRRCVDQCPSRVDVPGIMRSYMYAYGYRNLAKAKDTIRPALAEGIPCADCGACSVKCTMGFDVKSRIGDIARLGQVPDEFLA
ncbi:MAG: aldo/keto reductase [Candidatus Krumholzibacteria bacterium]|nr:aldo/keto reductase [Candidatus Krumholzibacteria bacterium]